MRIEKKRAKKIDVYAEDAITIYKENRVNLFNLAFCKADKTSLQRLATLLKVGIRGRCMNPNIALLFIVAVASQNPIYTSMPSDILSIKMVNKHAIFIMKAGSSGENYSTSLFEIFKFQILLLFSLTDNL